MPRGRLVPRVRWWHRAANGLRPDGNPLRRPVDRLESMLVFGLIGLFLLATPLIAVGVGRWAWDGASATARVEATSWHQVSAVVLRTVPGPRSDEYGAIYLAQVPVRWVTQDGLAHTGQVTAESGLRAGTQLSVWTNASGQLTGPPLGRAEMIHQAAFAGLMSVLGFALLLGVSALVIRRMLQRQRMAAWDAEWRATGPLWSNYR